MSHFNEDELTAPSWLNADFFLKVITQYKNDEDLEISHLELTPASVKGDHYASVMFRADVGYRSTKRDGSSKIMLIVKTIPEAEGMKREICEMSQVFETEIAMYTKTIPRFEAILAEHGEIMELAPKIIYHALEPQKVIILEDLCQRGFETLRERLPTLDEIKAIYRKIARLHAVSFMLAKTEEHELVTCYRSGMMSGSLFMAAPMITNGIKLFIEMLNTHEEFELYVPKFKAIEPELLESCRNLFTTYEKGANEELLVLNHGDFHCKNFMFKFDEQSKKLVDLLMIDLQASVFAPPTIDLFYSTFMLLSPQLRLKRDVVFHYYWEEFIASLKLIKYEGELPKFGELKVAGIKHRHFAIFMLTTFLPVMEMFLSATPEEFPTLEFGKFFENLDQMALTFRNPAYIAELRNLLPIFLHDGYLD